MKTSQTLQPKKHHGRPDLPGEHRWGDLGQLILLFIFGFIWVSDSFFLEYSTFPAEYVQLWLRGLIALVILSIAWAFARQGMKIVFGEKREKPELINKGVFKIVRHPIYLGAILLYLGLAVFTLSIASLVCWVFIVIFYIIISRYEERVLTEEFGEAYIQYKKDVPMLIPDIFGIKFRTND